MKKFIVLLFSLFIISTSHGNHLIVANRNVLTSSGGGASGTEFACDTFTDTNGVLLTAHTPTGTGCTGTWTVQTGSSGNMAITSNAIKDNTGTAPFVYISPAPATAEYTVQVSVTSTSDAGGPTCRTSTSAKTGYDSYYSNGAGQWILEKCTAGTFATLGTYTTTKPSGTAIKIQCYDATKELFIAGTSRISSADNTITGAGKAGVTGSGVTSDTLDNFTAVNK